MNYNFELAMSTYVSPTVVEEMIKQIVEDQTGKSIESIQVNYNDTQFNGFDVKFVPEIGKPNKPETTNLFDKNFKLTIWK
jgi:uncharacterized protein (UPF0335 family)